MLGERGDEARNPVAVMAALAIALVVAPVAAEVTDREVRQAIERGVEYLKTQQDKVRGGWLEHPTQPGGLSALCTLALLNSGVGVDDPAMAKALDYIRSFDKPDMTYSVALRTMVLCAAEPKKDLLVIRQNVKWLEATQLASGTSATRGRKGTWAYSARQEGQGDNSNTQFAMLALNEAERVGRRSQSHYLATGAGVLAADPEGGWVVGLQAGTASPPAA